MKKLLSIGEAAKALGVTTTTMRNWDKNGMLHPDEYTRGGD
ncbi:MAG: MerR family DNA-binding transcriptional regulator, partial [Prevotella sp.]|nr:MerR family DNA-binding transcriptional regulator [Prevotella sp.]